MIVEIVITIFALYWLFDYWYTKPAHQKFAEAKIQGPPVVPLFGNTLDFVSKTPEDVMDAFVSLRNKYGRTFRMFVFYEHGMFVSDAKDAEVILSSNKYTIKNNLYDILEKWLSTGLLISNGKKWYTRRKAITPTFHFKILDGFVEVFDKNSSILAEKLKSRADGKTTINIMPEVCLAALDIIAETAMGTVVNAQLDSGSVYTQAVNDLTNIMAYRLVKGWLRREWMFTLFEPFTKMRQTKLIKILHDFTDNVIRERREELKNQSSNHSDHDQDDIGTKKRMALLDVLLQSNIDGKPLSDKDIREEVDTFMFEGHDTTTSGISFTLYLISRHPEIQEKLFQEIREVYGDDKSVPSTMKTLGELKYLECVIKESMRMYPPVPIVGRHVPESFVMNGKVIPPKTNFMIAIWAMMRDETYFPDPDTFKPERFMTETSAENTNPYAFVPFSAGPRNCIGQKFAMLEMKSTISKVVRHYELLPLGEAVKPSMNVIMRSANGVQLGLRERKYL